MTGPSASVGLLEPLGELDGLPLGEVLPDPLGAGLLLGEELPDPLGAGLPLGEGPPDPLDEPDGLAVDGPEPPGVADGDCSGRSAPIGPDATCSPPPDCCRVGRWPGLPLG